MIESLICLGLAILALVGVVVWWFFRAVQSAFADIDRELER